jgi:hypothetical protein
MSVDEIMLSGLKLLGWDEKRLERCKAETNVDQYHGMFGMNPAVAAQLCEDLQTTTIQSARIESMDVDKLHWSLHFLYRYPTETKRKSLWNKCANNVCWSCWYYVNKI